MSKRWKRNELTERLGIDVPIVLGAFGGASSVQLTAAVSNAGGLGSYGLYGYDNARIGDTARMLRELSDRPFALNLWLPLDDDTLPSRAEFDHFVQVLAPWFEAYGLPLPDMPQRFLPDFTEQLDAALDARPAALSFVYGVPSREVIERAHAVGTFVVGTATTVAEAEQLDAGGVDAIIATGSEAGGHRVSFLDAPENSLVGTLSLVPRVVDRVSVPVIAAGGIADGRGVAAVLALGAHAAQIGTAFLACDESGANTAHREVLWSERAETTVLTSAFSGRLARGIPNTYFRELDGRDDRAPFPAQNWLSGRIKAEAAGRGDPEAMSLWAGQSAPLIRHHSASELMRAIVEHVDSVFQ